jgi:hypothetical protein
MRAKITEVTMATNNNFSPSAGLAAIARGLSRLSGTEVDGELVKVIAVSCGLGLIVALLVATSGFDMSIGFF